MQHDTCTKGPYYYERLLHIGGEGGSPPFQETARRRQKAQDRAPLSEASKRSEMSRRHSRQGSVGLDDGQRTDS